MLTRIVCIVVAAGSLVCCSKTDNGQLKQQEAMAQVNDATLYLSEVAEIIPKGSSHEDSIALVNRYVDDWVKKQLKLEQALQEMQVDDDAIEKRVREYREALILHAFEKQYVQQHLDTTVTEQEINAYYRDNLANFELKQNIVQGKLVAVSRNAPKLNQVKQWMRSTSQRDQQELYSYCYRFAKFYHLEDTVWMPLNELVHNTPFKEVPNEVQFLKQNNFAETSDEQNIYWLVIRQYKLSSQVSPLAFVHTRIRDMVINTRKQALIRDLEKKMYEGAQKKNKIKIYTNPTVQ